MPNMGNGMPNMGNGMPNMGNGMPNMENIYNSIQKDRVPKPSPRRKDMNGPNAVDDILKNLNSSNDRFENLSVASESDKSNFDKSVKSISVSDKKNNKNGITLDI